MGSSGTEEIGSTYDAEDVGDQREVGCSADILNAKYGSEEEHRNPSDGNSLILLGRHRNSWGPGLEGGAP
jgi:hypothetical protein